LEETGAIDIDYLAVLSNDAIPGLVHLAQNSPQWVRAELLPYLACRQSLLADRDKRTSWQSFHLSQEKAIRQLATIDNQLWEYQVELSERGWIVNGPDGEQSCFGMWEWGY
jgi:hypothetical protein